MVLVSARPRVQHPALKPVETGVYDVRQRIISTDSNTRERVTVESSAVIEINDGMVDGTGAVLGILEAVGYPNGRPILINNDDVRVRMEKREPVAAPPPAPAPAPAPYAPYPPNVVAPRRGRRGRRLTRKRGSRCGRRSRRNRRA